MSVDLKAPNLRRHFNPENAHIWVSPQATVKNKAVLIDPDEKLHESAVLLPVIRMRNEGQEGWKPDAYDYHEVRIDGPCEIRFTPYGDLDPNVWVVPDTGVTCEGIWKEELIRLNPPLLEKNVVFVNQANIMSSRKTLGKVNKDKNPIDPADIEWEPVLQLVTSKDRIHGLHAIRIEGPSRVMYGGPNANPHTLWFEFDVGIAWKSIDIDEYIPVQERPEPVSKSTLAPAGSPDPLMLAMLNSQVTATQNLTKVLKDILNLATAVAVAQGVVVVVDEPPQTEDVPQNSTEIDPDFIKQPVVSADPVATPPGVAGTANVEVLSPSRMTRRDNGA